MKVNDSVKQNKQKQCKACMSVIHADASVCPVCRMSQSRSKWKPIKNSIKWIGGITAMLTLLATMFQVSNLLDASQRRQEAVSELVLAGNMQREYEDYAAAWQRYEEALEIDPGHQAGRDEQIELALIWLKNIRTVGDQTFTEIVEKLLPALYLGAVLAEGSRAADITAHLGWAAYLRHREAQVTKDQVNTYFDAALVIDSSNVYANVMYGFWIIVSERDIEDARKYFTVALSSQREREYVRGLQLSALLYYGSDELNREILTVMNEMRINQEFFLSERHRSKIVWIYESNVSRDDKFTTIMAYLQPEDHLAIFRKLLGENERPESAERRSRFVIGRIQEAIGDTSQAVEIYRTLQSEFTSSAGTMPRAVDRALQRLTRNVE